MKLLFTVPLMSVLAAPVMAAELATGDEITAAISGNTVQGGMSDGTAYSEFYEVGGLIKADGYTGAWSIDGDQMCFDYGEGASCLSVSVSGETVTWVLDGVETGTGTIVGGNPNAY